jgi:hypothetical protein
MNQQIAQVVEPDIRVARPTQNLIQQLVPFAHDPRLRREVLDINLLLVPNGLISGPPRLRILQPSYIRVRLI